MNYICSEIVRYKVFFLLPKIHFVREKFLTSKVEREKRSQPSESWFYLGMNTNYWHQRE